MVKFKQHMSEHKSAVGGGDGGYLVAVHLNDEKHDISTLLLWYR